MKVGARSAAPASVLGPDAGQAVELPHGGGHAILRDAAGGDQVLHLGALLVDALTRRYELGLEADVAAEQAGREATLGLQLLYQVLHGEHEGDGAGRGGRRAVVVDLDDRDDAEQDEHGDDGQGEGSYDAAADRAAGLGRTGAGREVAAGGAGTGDSHRITAASGVVRRRWRRVRTGHRSRSGLRPDDSLRTRKLSLALWTAWPCRGFRTISMSRPVVHDVLGTKAKTTQSAPRRGRTVRFVDG
nr:hypothetical protein GCM10020092_041170 [Actinoplanes digitatis]